jgi:hypothetical protein
LADQELKDFIQATEDVQTKEDLGEMAQTLREDQGDVVHLELTRLATQLPIELSKYALHVLEKDLKYPATNSKCSLHFPSFKFPVSWAKNSHPFAV